MAGGAIQATAAVGRDALLAGVDRSAHQALADAPLIVRRAPSGAIKWISIVLCMNDGCSKAAEVFAALPFVFVGGLIEARQLGALDAREAFDQRRPEGLDQRRSCASASSASPSDVGSNVAPAAYGASVAAGALKPRRMPSSPAWICAAM